MKYRIALAAIPLAVLALAGCASTGPASAAGQPSGSAPAAAVNDPSAAQASASAIAAAASAAASAAAASAAAPCVTHSCIATELDKSLTGGIDQADAVATKVKCSSGDVKDKGSGNYTTWCTVQYSDGTTSEGYGTVDTSAGKVTFEPGD